MDDITLAVIGLEDLYPCFRGMARAAEGLHVIDVIGSAVSLGNDMVTVGPMGGGTSGRELYTDPAADLAHVVIPKEDPPACSFPTVRAVTPSVGIRAGINPMGHDRGIALGFPQARQAEYRRSNRHLHRVGAWPEEEERRAIPALLWAQKKDPPTGRWVYTRGAGPLAIRFGVCLAPLQSAGASTNPLGKRPRHTALG